jgi:hypothetical protein
MQQPDLHGGQLGWTHDPGGPTRYVLTHRSTCHFANLRLCSTRSSRLRRLHRQGHALSNAQSPYLWSQWGGRAVIQAGQLYAVVMQVYDGLLRGYDLCGVEK